MAERKFLYIGTDGVRTESAGAFESSDFLNSSTGASDAGKPIKLDADGHVDATMINDADIDHGNLTNTHNLTTDIDHDTLTNTHNLTTDIDHDQLTNFVSGEHFLQSAITQTGTVTSGTWQATVQVDAISELTPANGVVIDSTTIKDGGVDLAASSSLSVNGTGILVDSAGTMTLSNVDAIDATTETTLESAIDSLANLTTVGTITSGVWNGSAIPVANGGTGSTTALGATQNLGVEVGVDVQAYDAELSALAGLTSAANKIPYFTGSETADLLSFIDDDSMATASATSLASSESIKAYVDATAQGLAVHDPVRVATTAELGHTYNNGTSGVGATLTATTTSSANNTIDGITLIVGDRVLVKNQGDGDAGATAYENGIYEVTTLGNDTDANFTLTRAEDFDNSPANEIHDGDYFFVGEGTVNEHNGYVQTAVDPITVGTDAITFSQFSGAGQITAGEGLTKDGNTLDLALSELSIGALQSGDYIPFNDITDSSNKKITIANFVEYIDGDGLVRNGDLLDLSLGNVSGTNAVDVSADSIAILDATDSSTNIESIADLVDAIAGDGVTGQSDGTFDLDLNTLTGAVLVSTEDSIAFIDATDGSTKKESVVDFLGAVTGTLGTGIKVDSGEIAFEMARLSAGTAVNLDPSSDSMAFLTDSDTENRVISIADFMTDIAGSGLTATDGVLSVDAIGLSNLTDADTTGVADGHILIYDGVTDNRFESKAVSGDITISASGVTTISADAVDTTMIEWSTAGSAPTGNQISGAVVPLEDSGSYFSSDYVEPAINALATQIGGDTSTTFNFTESNVLADNDAVYASLEKLDLKWGDLGSTANNEGASLVGVEDSSGYFSGADVEAVLAELYGLATAGSAVTYTAGTGGVAKGDLIYVSANNTCLPYDTISTYDNVIGVAQSAATVGNPVTVLANDNIVSSLFVALTNIASLPSAGDTIYWWGNGGTYDFTTALTDFSSGDHVFQAGVAKNATDLHVQTELVMKKA